MDLYKDLRSRKRLWRAWTAVSSTAALSKAPQTREEARTFGHNIAGNIERLTRELRRQSFHFAPQKGVLLKKASGKKRPIVIAPIASRIVQRAILDCLQDIPALRSKLTAGYNFGGVPGNDFGVPGAILKVQIAIRDQDQGYFLRTDVKSFFDRVRKDDAAAQVVRFFDDPAFASLFRSAVETELQDASQYGSDVSLFPLFDEGVAQGSCLSPLLCNLLLDSFDQQMNARGIVTIRYIDDILILGKTRSNVFGAFKSAQELLKNFGLECYDPRIATERSKAEDGPTTKSFQFLGCEILGDAVRPSKSNRADLIAKVRTHVDASLDHLKAPRVAFKKHATYADTLYLLNKTIQGWANTFGFCTDDRVMGSLDAEISAVLRDYSNRVRQLLNRCDPLDARRALGVFVIQDRKVPLTTKLIRSTARLQQQ